MFYVARKGCLFKYNAESRLTDFINEKNDFIYSRTFCCKSFNVFENNKTS